MARGMLSFTGDFDEAKAIAGFLDQLSTEIKTDRHLSPVLNYTHSIMSEEFDTYMSAVAPIQANRFHHVYEWGMLGVPQGQLWKNVLRGPASNKIATFEWRASKKIVPVPDIPPGPSGQQLKEIHVFVWKAPVMEFNTKVTIEPKRGEWLAFPTGSPDNPLFFTKKPVTVNNPGGRATTGAFTAAFAGWWGGQGAQQIFEDRIRRVLEEDLARSPLEKAAKKFRRPTVKKFGMGTASADMAFKSGQAEAKRYMSKLQRNYIEQAKARERIIYG